MNSNQSASAFVASFADFEDDPFLHIEGNTSLTAFEAATEEAAWAALAGPVTVTYLPGFGPKA